MYNSVAPYAIILSDFLGKGAKRQLNASNPAIGYGPKIAFRQDREVRKKRQKKNKAAGGN